MTTMDGVIQVKAARKGRPGLFSDVNAVIKFMQEFSQQRKAAVPPQPCTVIDLARQVNAKFLVPGEHTDLTVRQAIYKLVRKKSGNRVLDINGIWTSRVGLKTKPRGSSAITA